VRALIRQEIGPDLAVIARSPQEIRQVLADNPFQDASDDPARVFYAFFESPPKAEALTALRARDFGGNRLVVAAHAAFMYIPADYTKASLNAAVLEKAAGVAVTMRNGNTLRKLAEMGEQPA